MKLTSLPFPLSQPTLVRIQTIMASSSSSSAPPASSSSILLPTPSGPQAGTTPQPAVDELAVQVRKTRLTGPEIVQLPPDGGYASDNDTDAESEASIGEDGEPKARDMLKDLPDDTDVSSVPSFMAARLPPSPSSRLCVIMSLSLVESNH